MLQVLSFKQQGADQPQPQPDQPSLPRVAAAQDMPVWVMEIRKDLEILEVKLTAKLDKQAAANHAKLDKQAAEVRLWFVSILAVLFGIGVREVLPLFKL